MGTEIEYESHELTIIRLHRSQTASVFCARCERCVLHLSLARAAAALGVTETAVFRLVENGAVHSCETAAGALLICGPSVAAFDEEIKLLKQ